MTDRVSIEKRSWIMSRIRSINTKPELLVQKIVRKLHIKYLRHDSSLPGSPDFSFPMEYAAIFVHGCFWHGHKHMGSIHIPKSNVEYWEKKIARNRTRDRKAKLRLTKMGWKYITIWECELKNEVVVKNRISKLLANLEVQEATKLLE